MFALAPGMRTLHKRVTECSPWLGLLLSDEMPTCLPPPIPRAGSILSWSYRSLERCRGPEEAPYLGVPPYSSSPSPASLQVIQAGHGPSSPCSELILQPHKVFCPLPLFPSGYTEVKSPPCLGDRRRGARSSLLGENQDRRALSSFISSSVCFLLSSPLLGGGERNCHPGFKRVRPPFTTPCS